MNHFINDNAFIVGVAYRSTLAAAFCDHVNGHNVRYMELRLTYGANKDKVRRGPFGEQGFVIVATSTAKAKMIKRSRTRLDLVVAFSAFLDGAEAMARVDRDELRKSVASVPTKAGGTS